MNIVFFTGAGISAESGVKTFRDNGGLWEEYKVEDVATKQAWQKNQKLVLDFYNKRHGELDTVEPNAAHKMIAELQATKGFDVEVITQNVDDLHERGGTKDVIHLHGTLLEKRSSFPSSVHKPEIVYPWPRGEDIKIGDTCEKGSQLRPNIVWFGENLDTAKLNRAAVVSSNADVFVIVGTSLEVQPAASLMFMTKETCLLYYIDPGDVNVNLTDYRAAFFYHIKEKATVGMRTVIDDILELTDKV